MIEAGDRLLALWLTAWLHGAILLALAWGLERSGLRLRPGWREMAWRAALFVPLFSAGLQALLVERPLAGVWHRLAVAPAPAMVSGPATASAFPPAQATAEGRHPGVAGGASRPWPIAMPACCAAQATPLAASDAPAAAPAAPVPPPAAVSASAAGPRPRAALATLLALLGALGVVRVLRRYRNERRRMRALPRLPDPQVQAELDRLRRAAALPALRLCLDPAIPGPLAADPWTVCLPPWAVDRLSPRQRAAVLAHEVAHLQRRDPGWRLALALHAACLPLPLAGYARARLHHLAELACDRWAATATGDPRAMAEALATAAREVGRRAPTPRFAAPMAARRSALLERVHHLLEEPAMSIAPSRAPRRAVLLGLALLAATAVLPGVAVGERDPAAPVPPVADASVPLPPAPPAAPAAAAAPAGTVNYIEWQWLFGSSSELSIDDGARVLRVEAKGDYTVNAAETDLATLDRAVSIEETADGRTRRLEFDHGRDGIERRYQVDGKPAAFDAAAAAWLADTLPRILRESGRDAEARAGRLFRQGGSAALLAEIGRIRSAHGRSAYLRALFAQPGLDLEAQQQGIALAAAITAEYERRVALQAALARDPLPTGALQAILQAVATQPGDYERRVLLQEAVARLGADAAAQSAWLAALATGSTAYETRVALQGFLDRPDLAAPVLREALARIAAIDEDYERRVALQAAVPALAAHPVLVADYAAALVGMRSDYERRVAIAALLKRVAPDAAGAAALIDAAGGIGSSYERRVALVGIVERMPAEAALLERCRDAARGLDEYERGRVEKALDRRRG